MRDAGKGAAESRGEGLAPGRQKPGWSSQSPWLLYPYHGHLFRSLGLSEEQGGCGRFLCVCRRLPP